MSEASHRPLVQRGPWLYRLGSAFFSLLVPLVYGFRVRDAERVPLTGPCVIAANHDSAWDPPVIGLATPRFVQFMAKRELFGNRVFAAALRGVGAFPVDRERNDVGAIKEALRRLQAGGVVGVFFEGTRRPEAKAAMGGAAFLAQRSGAALVPTAIWREGRRFHVRFGAPLRAEGRSRGEMETLTAAVRDCVQALQDDDASPPEH